MTKLRTVQVLGGGSAGSSAHVRSLAAGLVARGVRVTVCAPGALEEEYDFRGAGAEFLAVPRRSDPLALAALRAACEGAHVVHAHGLHAALRAGRVVASAPRQPLVVTWHALSPAEGARAQWLRLRERRAVRDAAVVLGASSVIVDRARTRGARDARLGAIGIPAPRRGAGPHPGKVRAELGAMDRALVVAVGALEPHRGHGTLLDAARVWRGREPVPLVAVAGEGPWRAGLQRRIDAEGLPVRLLGRRDDVASLLAAADVAVLADCREARPLLAQEALRLGVPLVAASVGGVPELVGEAVEPVPHGDAPALAAAVGSLLDDPERRAALAAAGRAQASSWPTEDDTVAQVLSVYDELRAGRG
ncbi:glycosyltransferase family 4 protein [Streptomyces sp. ODS05-4]|uniref:glycosyltransferase family 4 protein n=1 Tax=Streptomyces sp. ODS05-4 TaxID=2944939 RepID=UPI00210DE1E8|nr:glycosyltransferase family 4 protein [Streptomyces sp. ODS05-4]